MSLLRTIAFPVFSILIAFFGAMDVMRSFEVILGNETSHLELVADVRGNGHPEESESERESKTGEENETKEPKKKKVVEVDEYDAAGLEKARTIRLKSRHLLGNSASRLAIASARIWEPPERG